MVHKGKKNLPSFMNSWVLLDFVARRLWIIGIASGAIHLNGLFALVCHVLMAVFSAIVTN